MKNAVPQATSRDTIAHLSLVALGERLSDADVERWQARVNSEPDGLSRYIDSLLADPRFSRQQAPRLLFQTLAGYPPISYYPANLETTDKGVLFLNKPCEVRDAVKVRPWWSPSTPVLICMSSYLPEQFVDRNGVPCSHSLSQYEDTSCGCGPNLMRCFRDQAQYGELDHELQQEVVRTVAYVIEHDMPISEMFLSKYSFRSRNSEFVYRRWLTESRHLPELLDIDSLDQWPAGGQWALRFEETKDEHAGILTMPTVAWYDSGIRTPLKYVYDAMWCQPVRSSGVTSAAMIKLSEEAHGGADFREGFDASKELAHNYPCSGCHARLEEGGQFFLGYRTNPMPFHFVSSAQKNGQTGTLYGDDDQDVIGEGRAHTTGICEARHINATFQGLHDETSGGPRVRRSPGHRGSPTSPGRV